MVQCDLRYLAAPRLILWAAVFTGEIIMDKINLREILDGELIDEPDNLDLSEKLDFAMALTNALAARHSTFNGTPAEWDFITDNYLSYLMDNFPIEIMIAASVRSYRVHHIPFNSETDTFLRLFKEFTLWILSDEYEPPKVYIGDNQYVDYETWEKNKTPSKENYGGNFTLRDHNK